MNLAKQFNDLIPKQQISVATIIRKTGAGEYQAKTIGNQTVLLKGQAEPGQTFYYDVRTNILLTEAPNLTYTEIPV